MNRLQGIWAAMKEILVLYGYQAVLYLYYVMFRCHFFKLSAHGGVERAHRYNDYIVFTALENNCCNTLVIGRWKCTYVYTGCESKIYFYLIISLFFLMKSSNL